MTRIDWLLLGAALAFALALGWYSREAAVQDCAALVNSDHRLCAQLGGVIDGDEYSTVCVFPGTTPP